uniref:EXPERA domain-containing protein n=1 Tax=Polytomella parva TaxID=51329 RepID=A0A7S0V657_9CHLO|mmetsp:Transcript_28903/g.53105  ORF Transcript_28903/g.53105 Transcript_28903/m.53105 type:complete len:158 (+) Transcript_28903:57-530(+)
MGFLNNVYLLFFLFHIPTTILIDSQGLIPRHLFPSWAVTLFDWHVAQNDDFLLRENRPWFKSLVYCECFIQLPFFFLASYAFLKKRNWIRIPALIYGVHVSTTMAPILYEILFGDNFSDKRYQLALIYAPYLAIPFMLSLSMAFSPYPFTKLKSKKQ